MSETVTVTGRFRRFKAHGSKPFTTLTLAVLCATCWLEMPREEWPSHYRTKAHRDNLHLPTAERKRRDDEAIATFNDWLDGPTARRFADDVATTLETLKPLR